MSNIRCRRRGFSLVEAILVIGLVTVLATIFSSVVIRARRTSRTVACMSNLRQIATALLMYHADTGHIALPQQPGLPATLAKYVTDEKVFVCPASPHYTTDSYSRHYVPRPPTEPNGFLVGCANHGAMDMTAGTFGSDGVIRGQTAAVTWNDEPVAIGAEVEGGLLRFADGTRVSIDSGLKVVVLASFDEGRGKLYSAIRIPTGAYGSIEVQAAHGTHFDVATPTCTAGVKGTTFTVTTSSSQGKARTRVRTTKGVVAVDSHWPVPRQVLLRAGDSDTFVLPDDSAPILTDLTVAGPFFAKKDAIYKVTNDTGALRQITQIFIRWPFANSRLKDIHFGKHKIFDSDRLPPCALIASCWDGPPKERQIRSGETRELRFHFVRHANTTADAYLIKLTSEDPQQQDIIAPTFPASDDDD